MRAIDADALIRKAQIEAKGMDEPFGSNFAVYVEWLIDKMPTIEPEWKKGKWERHYSRPNVYADLYWHCSECGYKNDDQYANIYHKFCPNCGADMRGDSHESD